MIGSASAPTNPIPDSLLPPSSRYVSCLAIPILLFCFAISSEPKSVFHVINADLSVLGWATFSAFGNLCFAFLTYTLVVVTSALTTSVGEDIKRVVMILYSVGITHSGYVAVNYVGLSLFVPGCLSYAYFAFLRRFEKLREPPALEAGMGVAMKGKSEGSSLLPDDAMNAGPVCCLLQ